MELLFCLACKSPRKRWSSAPEILHLITGRRQTTSFHNTLDNTITTVPALETVSDELSLVVLIVVQTLKTNRYRPTWPDPVPRLSAVVWAVGGDMRRAGGHSKVVTAVMASALSEGKKGAAARLIQFPWKHTSTPYSFAATDIEEHCPCHSQYPYLIFR